MEDERIDNTLLSCQSVRGVRIRHVVQDTVEDHLDVVVVERLDHRFELRFRPERAVEILQVSGW